MKYIHDEDSANYVWREEQEYNKWHKNAERAALEILKKLYPDSEVKVSLANNSDGIPW